MFENRNDVNELSDGAVFVFKHCTISECIGYSIEEVINEAEMRSLKGKGHLREA